MAAAHGDSLFPVFGSEFCEPLMMHDILSKIFASNYLATRTSVLKPIYSNVFVTENDMLECIDAFESLFSHLDRMAKDTRIPELHKMPLLNFSIASSSPLKSTFTGFQTEDLAQKSRNDVSADLILAFNRVQMHGDNIKRDKHQGIQAITGNGQGPNSDNGNIDGGHKRNSIITVTKIGSLQIGHEKGCRELFAGALSAKRLTAWEIPTSLAVNSKTVVNQTMKRLNTYQKSATSPGKQMHNFGVLVLVTVWAKKSGKRDEPGRLKSCTAGTMFHQPYEVIPGTYKGGFKDSVEFSAGASLTECPWSGTISVETVWLQNLPIFSWMQYCFPYRIL